MHDSMNSLVLASGSPRRRALITALGAPCRVLAPEIDESVRAGESPAGLARRLSRAKALVAAAGVKEGIIIAADTIVTLDDRILGKPASPEEARAMLRALRGRRHSVLTGIALIARPAGALLTDLAETPVEMRAYSDEEIEAYIASGDPLDKAGAYAIQHEGFNPVARITTCYANVVGFPLCHIYRGLRRLGYAHICEPVAGCRALTGYACAYYPQVLGA